jgi:hypothetical protein
LLDQSFQLHGHGDLGRHRDLRIVALKVLRIEVVAEIADLAVAGDRREHEFALFRGEVIDQVLRCFDRGSTCAPSYRADRR